MKKHDFKEMSVRTRWLAIESVCTVFFIRTVNFRITEQFTNKSNVARVKCQAVSRKAYSNLVLKNT